MEKYKEIKNIYIREMHMYMEICKCTKSHTDVPVSFTIYANVYLLGNILNTKYYKYRSMFSTFIYSLYSSFYPS